ncbi:hypothetical protein ABIF50_001852 [Bradyrhizobium diazoefficiens]
MTDRDGFVRRGVLDIELERTAEHAAGGVDLLDHHLGDIGVGIARVGDRAGEIGGNADLDRGFGRIGPGAGITQLPTPVATAPDAKAKLERKRRRESCVRSNI